MCMHEWDVPEGQLTTHAIRRTSGYTPAGQRSHADPPA